MQLEAHTQERGVTPVIGVILVVAVTVVLASIVGAYALGLGSGISEANPPDMSFDFDYVDSGGDELTVTFRAGERVQADRLELVVSGAAAEETNGRYAFTGDLGADADRFEAEESVILDDGDVDSVSDLDLGEATVRVVWTSRNTNPDATRSSTVARWTGPEA
jgi:flagellin-like protein